MARPAESIVSHSELSDLVAVWIKFRNDSWKIGQNGTDVLVSSTPIEWAAFDARGVLLRTLEYFGQTVTEAQMSPTVEDVDRVWNTVAPNQRQRFARLTPSMFGLLRFGVDDVGRVD